MHHLISNMAERDSLQTGCNGPAVSFDGDLETIDPVPPTPAEGHIEIPCPSHDNPILLIPRPYRRAFLDELLPKSDFKKNALYIQRIRLGVSRRPLHHLQFAVSGPFM